jgi:tRNA(adenine34) deaminase
MLYFAERRAVERKNPQKLGIFSERARSSTEFSGSSAISRQATVSIAGGDKMNRSRARSKSWKASRRGRSAGKRWVRSVKTDSTHPPRGLFNQSAAKIAKSLASKRVSPKGPGSGMRMLTYYINRGGRNLSGSRRATLERAKALLRKRMQKKSSG